MTKRPLFIIAVFLVLGEFLAGYGECMAFIWMAGMFMPAIFLFAQKRRASGTACFSILPRVCFSSCSPGNGKTCKACFKWFWREINEKERRLFLLLPLVGMIGAGIFLAADTSDALLVRYQAEEKNPIVRIQGKIEKIQEKGDKVWLYLPNASVIWEPIQYRKQGVIINCAEEMGLRIGNKISAEGELGTFSRAYNPGEFNLYEYYRANGYCYYIKDGAVIIATEEEEYDWLRENLRQIRKKLSECIRNIAVTEKDAGVFCAVLLGETDEVDEDLKELYKSQGIAHLLSVSGLHVSMIGRGIYHVLRLLTGSLWFSGFAGGSLVVLYGMMIGNPLSARRAICMYLLSVLAQAKGRVYDAKSAAGLAAIWLAISNPLAVRQAPFLLSFTAVLGSSFIGGAWSAFFLHKPKKDRLSILGMQTGMLPVILYFYFQYPLYSILLNQLILPFGGVLIASAAGCALLGAKEKAIGRVSAFLGHFILIYYEKLCHIFEGFPGSIQVNGRPSDRRLWFYTLLLVAAAAVSLWYRRYKKVHYNVETVPKGWKRRRLIVYIAASAFLFQASIFLHAESVTKLTVWMLDVGQGDCFLIRIPGGINLLSDAGSTSKSELFKYILEPALLSQGIGKLDGVLLSHADADHVSAVSDLLESEKIEVKTLILPSYQGVEDDFSKIFSESFVNTSCQVRFLQAGDRILAEKAGITCFHPEEGKKFEDKNDTSLTYLLTYGSFSMLFTGDLGMTMEPDIGQMIDVLKVPHHGSRYSASENWLTALSPRAAFISCGKNNRYNHPHTELLLRLEAVGTDIYLTNGEGAVKLVSDGNGFEIFSDF